MEFLLLSCLNDVEEAIIILDVWEENGSSQIPVVENF
jgi:hypothetical protein